MAVHNPSLHRTARKAAQSDEFRRYLLSVQMMKELQDIYVGKISEALARLAACERFMNAYSSSHDVYALEASILQARKAMEAVAFAAIAPNKSQYAKFRAQAEKSKDYTRDYNARSILQHLGKINADFYPVPVSAPIAVSPGKWHFDRRLDDSLTKTRFEAIYDRLGKYLHSDNPWGDDKNVANLVTDIPGLISATRSLLSWHFTTIRSPEFSGVWIVEAPRNGAAPRIVTGQADGEFVIA